MNAGLYFKVIGLALLICGLLVLAAWLVRRLRGVQPAPGEEIRVCAIRALTHRCQVALIEVMGERFLIGLGEGGPRLLGRLPARAPERREGEDASAGA